MKNVCERLKDSSWWKLFLLASSTALIICSCGSKATTEAASANPENKNTTTESTTGQSDLLKWSDEYIPDTKNSKSYQLFGGVNFSYPGNWKVTEVGGNKAIKLDTNINDLVNITVLVHSQLLAAEEENFLREKLLNQNVIETSTNRKKGEVTKALYGKDKKIKGTAQEFTQSVKTKTAEVIFYSNLNVIKIPEKKKTVFVRFTCPETFRSKVQPGIKLLFDTIN